MKTISFAVPCYNSANYMEKCVDSLLPCGDDIEIILVNDGSTRDNTAEIADRLAEEHPGIVRAIHKENGGHGSAVNAGLAAAQGYYYILTTGLIRTLWMLSCRICASRRAAPKSLVAMP